MGYLRPIRDLLLKRRLRPVSLSVLMAQKLMGTLQLGFGLWVGLSGLSAEVQSRNFRCLTSTGNSALQSKDLVSLQRNEEVTVKSALRLVYTFHLIHSESLTHLHSQAQPISQSLVISGDFSLQFLHCHGTLNNRLVLNDISTLVNIFIK